MYAASTGPYSPGTLPAPAPAADPCCPDCAEHDGLGFTPVAFITDQAVKHGGSLIEEAGSLIFGGKDRHAGADCCPTDEARGVWPAGYDPPHPYPTNSNRDGAPPDYRTPGPPFTAPSREGFKRAKDDYCNCFPIVWNGKMWALGYVDGGAVYLGAPPSSDLNSGVWVEVNRSGEAVSVPGYGDVSLEAPATDPFSGGSAGPADPGWTGTVTDGNGAAPPPAPREPATAGVPPLALAALVGVGAMIAFGGK